MQTCARLFICALWSPAGKGLTSRLSFVVYHCEFVAFPLVSWVSCGIDSWSLQPYFPWAQIPFFVTFDFIPFKSNKLYFA